MAEITLNLTVSYEDNEDEFFINYVEDDDGRILRAHDNIHAAIKHVLLERLTKAANDARMEEAEFMGRYK